MISVIVSSHQPDFFERLTRNIASTIGVTYEIIKIHNPSQKSICKAYNEGLASAKYDQLCFCHEDIAFLTNNWGSSLIEIFNEHPRLGLLGIAGAKSYGNCPAAWWELGSGNNLCHISEKLGLAPGILVSEGWQETNDNIQKVVVVDGVFLCMRKASGIRFDEDIPGFHAYDLSLSLSFISNGWGVGVTNKILLEHFSKGSKNASWYNAMDVFYRKYATHLPLSLGVPVRKSDEDHCLINFVSGATENHLGRLALKYWVMLLFRKPFSKSHPVLLKKIIWTVFQKRKGTLLPVSEQYYS